MLSLSAEAKKKKREKKGWRELVNEASAHTFPAEDACNPCKYCWAGGEAEREAVVVGAAARRLQSLAFFSLGETLRGPSSGLAEPDWKNIGFSTALPNYLPLIKKNVHCGIDPVWQ